MAFCRATASGHVAEVAIPAAYLDSRQGGAWREVRLNLGANDYDREWSVFEAAMRKVLPDGRKAIAEMARFVKKHIP